MATDLSKYKFNSSMLRVKDPQASLEFYEYLGMKLIKKLPNPDGKFDLYFLAYDGSGALSKGHHFTDRQGVVELMHNHGTESDPNFKVANGNSDPGRGFGHLCVSVDNIQAACQRLEDAGYKFQKKLTDGRMRSIAFVLDPDSYWVEIIPTKPVEKTENVKTTDVGTYRMNHTMIRVKDGQKTIKFYENNFGMRLISTMENPDAQFNLYFLGYGATPEQSLPNGTNPRSTQEGLLELTWNYGTEKDPNFKYHDGNSDPVGFGHICVSVDDLDSACERLEHNGVKFFKKVQDWGMPNIAFAIDPDGYRIELVQNEQQKPRAHW